MDSEEKERLIQLCSDRNKEKLIELLDGSFLNNNPYELSDEELMDYLVDRTNRYDSGSLFSHFFTLHVNRGLQERYYNQFYKVVVFERYKSDQATPPTLEIKCSQFQYYMSLYYIGPINTSWAKYDPQNANLICQVDDSVVNPYQYFAENKDKIFMLAACYPCVNSYDKPTACYDLISFNENRIDDYVRKNIFVTQIYALYHLIGCPYLYTTSPINEMVAWKYDINQKAIFGEVYSEYESQIKEKLHFLESRQQRNN